jgi:tetratricopeptide (TPR) repeat protein
MIRGLLVLVMFFPFLVFTGEAPATNADGKVLFKGKWVTQEFKDKSEQGLVLYKGTWMPEAEKYKAMGYVKNLGTWISPQRLRTIQKQQAAAREQIKFRGDWKNAWVFNTQPGHFSIVSNVSPELVGSIGVGMEQCYNELAKVFGAKTNLKNIKVEVYATQEQFMKYSGEAGLAMSSNVLGYFWYRGQEMGIRCFYAGSPEQTMSTLFHECTHLVIHSVCERVPTWANEGLAVFFESAKRDDKSMKLETIPFNRLWQLKSMLKEGELSLDKLCQLSGAKEYSGEYYPQGWALIYFMLYAEKGKYRKPFENFYSGLSSKKWDGDNMGVFRKYFGREPQAFYPDWKAYVMAIEPRTADEFISASITAYTDWPDFETAQTYATKALELTKGKNEQALLCNARLYLTLGRWMSQPEEKAEHYAKSVGFFEQVFPPVDENAKKPAKSKKITTAFAADRLDFARACVGAARYEQAQDLVEEVLSTKEFRFNPQAYSMLAYIAIMAEDPAYHSLEVAKENAVMAEDLGADQENKYVQALIALEEGNKSLALKFLNEAASRDQFSFGGQFFRREALHLTMPKRKVTTVEEVEEVE